MAENLDVPASPARIEALAPLKLDQARDDQAEQVGALDAGFTPVLIDAGHLPVQPSGPVRRAGLLQRGTPIRKQTCLLAMPGAHEWLEVAQGHHDNSRRQSRVRRR